MENDVKQQNCGIYKITNLINQKVYIGQSNDIKRRWQEHRTKSKYGNTLLYQAIRQYGIENFDFSIIELCKIEELNEKEQYYINFYNSAINGYNMDNIPKQQYILNNDTVLLIINDLKNSTLSQNDLAKKYNVSHSLISQINTGKMWAFKDIQYPIRDNKIISKIRVTNYCLKCGKEIGYKSTYCVDCYKENKYQHIVNAVSREDLKFKIRTMPFTLIAKEFKTTDKAIRRWCKFYNLPSTKKEINSYSDKDWELV